MPNKIGTRVSQKIIDTYTIRLTELEPHKQRHFLYRALKIDNRKKLREQFKKIKENTKKEKRKIINYLKNSLKLEKENLKNLVNYKIKKINDKKKLEQWKKYISVYTYHSILWSLYYIKTLRIKFPSFFKEKLKKRGAKQIDIILSNPLFIKFAVVSAVNCIYHSKNLLNFDKEKQFLDLFRKIFKNENKKWDDLLFTNYIYGLTHIIIGASKFYTNKVSGKNWILREFKKYEKEIYEKLTLDINIEVALCYKLCSFKENEFVNKIKKRLIKNFDIKDGYIKREKDNDFSFAEHTNAIALLLLNFDKIKFYA